MYVPGQPKKRSSTLASIDANSDASSVADSDADNVNPAQTDEGTGGKLAMSDTSDINTHNQACWIS